MTHGKENDELPLWSGKIEDLEIWELRRQTLQHSTEDGEKKTCAPRICPNMINKSNFANIRKILTILILTDFHKMMNLIVSMNMLKQNLKSTRFKKLAVSLTTTSRLRENMQRLLGLTTEKYVLMKNLWVVPAPAGQNIATPDAHRVAFVQATIDAVAKQEMPRIFRKWMFLKNNLQTTNEKSHIRSLTRGKLGLSTVVDTLQGRSGLRMS